MGTIMFGWFKKKDAQLPAVVGDAKKAADWISKALASSGYRADFSVESLHDIDRFFDEHAQNGQAIPGGLLSEQLGSRIFAIGSYIGEVIIRAYNGSWQTDDNDPEAEMNIAIVLNKGTIMWPVQRAMKRFKNGPQDGIYVYGRVANE